MEAAHEEMQSELQATEKDRQSTERNTPLLNEKEQKEAVYQQIVCKLQVSEKNNEDLRVMFEEDKSQKDMKSLLQELQQRHAALQTIH